MVVVADDDGCWFWVVLTVLLVMTARQAKTDLKTVWSKVVQSVVVAAAASSSEVVFEKQVAPISSEVVFERQVAPIITSNAGDKFHYSRSCQGLNLADKGQLTMRTLCLHCERAKTAKIQ
jgi:putative transposon-encoded protein